MKAVFLSLILICGAGFGPAGAADNETRFTTVEIYLDSSEPVAAWQFELNERNGVMKVVGVENGDSEAFDRAPYYDREAVQLGTADRIIVADYSLADKDLLPSGRVRVATVHLMLSSQNEPDFDVQLITANTHDGQVIDASIGLESPTGSEQ